jgi:hypothetical protein
LHILVHCFAARIKGADDLVGTAFHFERHNRYYRESR